MCIAGTAHSHPLTHETSHNSSIRQSPKATGSRMRTSLTPTSPRTPSPPSQASLRDFQGGLKDYLGIIKRLLVPAALFVLRSKEPAMFGAEPCAYGAEPCMKDRGRASSPRLNSHWLFRWLFRMLLMWLFRKNNHHNTQHTKSYMQECTVWRLCLVDFVV